MRFSPIKPDGFRGDPLGYGGNFCGHFVIPGLIAWVVCDLWLALPPVPGAGLQAWLAFGEFPHKAFLVALIVGVYMMVEIPQRGPAFDTFEDIAVIMAGLTCWVGLFSEIQAGDPELAFDYPSMQWLLRGVAAWLLLGMAYRELQRRKDDA
jgi:hypothetical protein